MAKIILSYRRHFHGRKELPTYSLSVFRAFKAEGHEVTRVGKGQDQQFSDLKYSNYDLFIDVDCGRDGEGNLHFLWIEKKCPIPSAVWVLDSHNHHYGTLHHRMAPNYDHVFFAVWNKRDLFTKHPSTHWSPCASDDFYFDYKNHKEVWGNPKTDFGFYGSKGGLDRADDLKTICKKRGLSCDVREIGASFKSRWPRTAAAMANCKHLFNHGQKHDGPNQRVIESMLMNRPLLTDRDKQSGMSKIFEEGVHYLGYDSIAELGLQVDWLIDLENSPLKKSLAKRAYEEVKSKHLISHRVKQILEVCNL